MSECGHRGLEGFLSKMQRIRFRGVRGMDSRSLGRNGQPGAYQHCLSALSWVLFPAYLSGHSCPFPCSGGLFTNQSCPLPQAWVCTRGEMATAPHGPWQHRDCGPALGPPCSPPAAPQPGSLPQTLCGNLPQFTQWSTSRSCHLSTWQRTLLCV